MLLQELAVPFAEFGAAGVAFWARLEEHRRRPGPRRGDDWRPTPDLVPPLRQVISLLKSMLLVLVPILEATEAEADAAERALAALDCGAAVIDAEGNVVRAPRENPPCQ